MAYSIDEAKKLIIKAGLELVEKKLIARTWGNISARISDTEFVITPSGVAYDQVNENNLVVVKISDCSYEGNIKPSGEKKVHAMIYQNRKNVNFILHTHQNYATAVSVDGYDKSFAPVAKYGLPSTKKLVNNIKQKLNQYPLNNVFLMERHGALILSESYEDAFNRAIDLEEKAKKLFEERTNKQIEKNDESIPYLDDYAQMFGHGKKAVEEDQEAISLIKLKNSLASQYADKNTKPLGYFDVSVQHFIYKMKYAKLKDKNK